MNRIRTIVHAQDPTIERMTPRERKRRALRSLLVAALALGMTTPAVIGWAEVSAQLSMLGAVLFVLWLLMFACLGVIDAWYVRSTTSDPRRPRLRRLEEWLIAGLFVIWPVAFVSGFFA